MTTLLSNAHGARAPVSKFGLMSADLPVPMPAQLVGAAVAVQLLWQASASLAFASSHCSLHPSSLDPLPSSHSSPMPGCSTPSPQTSATHTSLHPSLVATFPSSHC